MTNNKRFISLTGTTCAGKSTALKALKQSGAERFMVIPQVTRRNPRTDDAPECFIYTKNIIPNEMFLYNKDLSYGISRQSLLDFMNSDCQIALASLCSGVAHRSLTASQSKDCSLSLAELRPARSPDIASQAQPSAN